MVRQGHSSITLSDFRSFKVDGRRHPDVVQGATPHTFFVICAVAFVVDRSELDARIILELRKGHIVLLF